MYRIEYKRRAQKFIEAQSRKIQRQLINRIEALQEDPRPPNSTLLDSGKKIYRVRSGDYRIVYQVKDRVLLVIVAAVAHRKDVYEALKQLRKSL